MFFTVNRVYVPASAFAYIGIPVRIVLLSQKVSVDEMREKYVEQRLFKAVRQSGGLALKLISPGFNGVPDRLLLFMGGKAAFCEVKAPGQKPRPLQVHRMNQLRKLGFKVFVVDDVNQIGGMIDEIWSA